MDVSVMDIELLRAELESRGLDKEGTRAELQVILADAWDKEWEDMRTSPADLTLGDSDAHSGFPITNATQYVNVSIEGESQLSIEYVSVEENFASDISESPVSYQSGSEIENEIPTPRRSARQRRRSTTPKISRLGLPGPATRAKRAKTKADNGEADGCADTGSAERIVENGSHTTVGSGQEQENGAEKNVKPPEPTSAATEGDFDTEVIGRSSTRSSSTETIMSAAPDETPGPSSGDVGKRFVGAPRAVAFVPSNVPYDCKAYGRGVLEKDGEIRPVIAVHWGTNLVDATHVDLYGADVPTLTPEELADITHIDDLVVDEKQSLSMKRGTKHHGCPFCAYSSPKPGLSHIVRNHAYAGRMRGGKQTSGCVGYKTVADLFNEKQLPLKKDTDFGLELMTVKGKKIADSERKNVFLSYVLKIAGEGNFLDHPSVARLKECYVQRPMKKNERK